MQTAVWFQSMAPCVAASATNAWMSMWMPLGCRLVWWSAFDWSIRLIKRYINVSVHLPKLLKINAFLLYVSCFCVLSWSTVKQLLQRGATGENLLTILHYVNEKLVGSLKKSEGEKLISGVWERVSGNARQLEDQFQIVLGEEAALYVSACCCQGTESGTVRVSVDYPHSITAFNFGNFNILSP